MKHVVCICKLRRKRKIEFDQVLGLQDVDQDTICLANLRGWKLHHESNCQLLEKNGTPFVAGCLVYRGACEEKQNKH